MVGSALITVGCALSSSGSGASGTTSSTITAPASQTSLDKEALSDFDRRVHRYMTLQDKLQRQGTRQKQRADVGENIVSRQALATRIRFARHDSKQGDILGPPIAAALRRAMNPELRGDAAAGTRKSIREEAPATFKLEVNGAYPEGASRSTMPGNVLAILPVLPEGLEYRIVDTHLVLMDLDANIVVDYLLDVM